MKFWLQIATSPDMRCLHYCVCDVQQSDHCALAAQVWPKDALEAVAYKFLKEMDLDDPTRAKLVELCQSVHRKVGPDLKLFLLVSVTCFTCTVMRLHKIQTLADWQASI